MERSSVVNFGKLFDRTLQLKSLGKCIFESRLLAVQEALGMMSIKQISEEKLGFSHTQINKFKQGRGVPSLKILRSLNKLEQELGLKVDESLLYPAELEARGMEVGASAPDEPIKDRLERLNEVVGTWEKASLLLGYSSDHLIAVANGRRNATPEMLGRLKAIEDENGLRYAQSDASRPDLMGEASEGSTRLPRAETPTREELHQVLDEWITAHSRDPASMVHAMHVLKHKL